MNPAIAHLALAISTALFDSLWQGALIVGVVWIGLRCLPAIGAATRYAVWFCTLLALIVIPVLAVISSPVLRHASTSAPISNSASIARFSKSIEAGRRSSASEYHIAGDTPQVATALPPASTQIAVPEGLPMIAVLLWLLAACLRGGMLGVNGLDLVAIRRSSRLWSSAYDYPVLLSDRTNIPLAIGLFHPAIILPASLVSEQSTDSIEAIIIHETAHLHRYDVWTNALIRIAESILALNPIAWVVVRKLSIEREIACDDWVVAKLDAGEVLARALAVISQCGVVGAPLAAPSAVGPRHSLVLRIERLLNSAPRHLRLSAPALGGTLMILAMLAILVQSISPILAYASPPSHAMRVASACSVPNRSVQYRMVLYTHNERKVMYEPLRTKDSLGVHSTGERLVPVELTVDASGVARKVVIESSAIKPLSKQMLLRALLNQTYRPARVNCTNVSSTLRTWVVERSGPSPSILLSTVSPSYPNGWSDEHPSSCKVPTLIHGAIPAPRSFNIAPSKAVSATARIRVDAAGAVTKAKIVASSGIPTFDKSVLAAARAATYPLDGRTGFQPVRPSHATLAWNATHGYRAYSKCAPLPTSYLWKVSYTPNS